METIHVSVIVPVYNSEAFLPETLSALAAQTLQSLEVLLIDDGSTDAGPELLDRFCADHPRFHVLHRENQGAFSARLAGVRAARGEFVAFCDSDDLPIPSMYEKMLSCARAWNADMVSCAFTREEMPAGRRLSVEMAQFESRAYSLPEEADLLPVVNTALWNKLIRRSVLANVIDFEDPPRILEDMMFLCSLYPSMRIISFVPEVLYRYRVRSGSLMSYVNPQEVRHLQSCMIQTRAYVAAQGNHPAYLQVCDSMAFVHLGLSLVIHQAQGGMRTGACVREAKSFLRGHFPGYRRAGQTLFWNLTHRLLQLKLYLARCCFECGLMTPAVWLYQLITQKLKHEIKW